MSTPEIRPTTYNVMSEIGSARSSLHCSPDPILDPPEDAMFLDELDEMVVHSATHLHAASASIMELESDMQEYREELARYQWKGFEDVSLEAVIDKLDTWLGR